MIYPNRRNNKGCYVHTKEVVKGSGKNNHVCWVFSKCKGNFFILTLTLWNIC